MIEGGHGVRVTVDGRGALNFCSNDYLGLAADARIGAALGAAARTVGTGSGASQLVTGYNAEHAALEAELAHWVGRERALVFSTGYAANVGVIAALLGRHDHIVADALNHASLIDGSRLSGASKHIYAHGDAAAADTALAEAGDGHRLLVTDAVFSMDGDTAPLAELAEVARARDAWLLVDDAHGLGVFGPDGAGRVAEAGLSSRAVPLLTGTLGKSVGAAGAFVAGDDDIIETILQTRALADLLHRHATGGSGRGPDRAFDHPRRTRAARASACAGRALSRRRRRGRPVDRRIRQPDPARDRG